MRYVRVRVVFPEGTEPRIVAEPTPPPQGEEPEPGVRYVRVVFPEGTEPRIVVEEAELRASGRPAGLDPLGVLLLPYILLLPWFFIAC